MLKIIKPGTLEEARLDELSTWLDAFSFSRDKTAPHKFFSDGGEWAQPGLTTSDDGGDGSGPLPENPESALVRSVY